MTNQDPRSARPQSQGDDHRPKINIPTDLLRTPVAVVDLRSFTRSAQWLGVTQPAVSAQIKRLQQLVGYDLLDKSAPGVSLTPRGEIMVTYARRLLAINDEIAQVTGGLPATQILRIGLPTEYAAGRVPAILARFRTRWPDIRFEVTSQPIDTMLRELQQGDLDLAVTVGTKPVSLEARHLWREETVWVRSKATQFDLDGPVPLVSYGEDGIYNHIAVTLLHRAGRDCDMVFTTPNLVSMAEAIHAGLGIMLVTRNRAARMGAIPWDDAPLPKPPAVYCGIFIRDGGNRQAIEELADNLAADLRPQPPAAAAPPAGGADAAAG